MATFELATIDGTPNRLINGQTQTRRNGVLVRAAKHYRVTDPHDLARKLESRGYQILDIQAPRIWHSTVDESITRQGRRFLLTAKYPGAVMGNEYHDFVKFLLDHSGREKFKVQAGALRCACSNQFYGEECLSVHHTSSVMDTYLEEPWLAAERVRGNGAVVAGRLEELHGIGSGQALIDTLLRKDYPRLHSRACNAFLNYGESDFTFTFWSALQAFTATRSPKLTALAARCLAGDTWECIKTGRIPTQN